MRAIGTDDADAGDDATDTDPSDPAALGDGGLEDAGGEYAFNGGIHAAEHGIISLFPFHLLCDRGDIGGISTPHHPHVDAPAVFVYDGYPGGVGLTRRGHARIGELMRRAARLIDGCECADGCPSCVQSPHCGNANEPLAPAPAVHLLESLAGDGGPQTDANAD
jgi:Distinct helicase family with a unique C-terminal domain including a metal-binding cysteine cluster